jgi:hypothetical protein
MTNLTSTQPPALITIASVESSMCSRSDFPMKSTKAACSNATAHNRWSSRFPSKNGFRQRLHYCLGLPHTAGQHDGCIEGPAATTLRMLRTNQLDKLSHGHGAAVLLTHRESNRPSSRKPEELLEVSYKRLTGFESSTKGYEWFRRQSGDTKR